jgi:hypothetical protein
MNGFTISSSAVNYTSSGTGLVGVTFSPAAGTGVPVFIRYQQQQSGDIIPSQNQICQWNQDVYTYIGY